MKYLPKDHSGKCIYSELDFYQGSGEPCSSSGRTRTKRSGIIPKEGEDESSFDEDEEDTEEEEDSDEVAEPWKSGSEDEEDRLDYFTENLVQLGERANI